MKIMGVEFLDPTGFRSPSEVMHPLDFEGYVDDENDVLAARPLNVHLWLTPDAARRLIRDLMENLIQSEKAGGGLHEGRTDVINAPCSEYPAPRPRGSNRLEIHTHVGSSAEIAKWRGEFIAEAGGAGDEEE